MFDIGWSELAVVALLALLVVGPKDLPRVMRTVSQWVRKAQRLAREFQSGLDDMVREADLQDAKKLVDAGRSMNVNKIVEDTLDPTGSVREEAEAVQASVRDAGSASEAPAGKSEAGEAKTGEAKTGDTKTGAAKPDSPAPETADSASDGEDAPKATVIKHPVQVAPPHSITPPPEPEAETAAAAGEDDGSKKTA
jgi:sec-independent protein translocase protein TatB